MCTDLDVKRTNLKIESFIGHTRKCSVCHYIYICKQICCDVEIDVTHLFADLKIYSLILHKQKGILYIYISDLDVKIDMTLFLK